MTSQQSPSLAQNRYVDTFRMLKRQNRIKVIKGEIHNVLTVMRTDVRYASPLRFSQHSATVQDHPLLEALQDLHQELSVWNVSQELAVSLYLSPFCAAIAGRDISASVTGCALSALHKLVLYGFMEGNREGLTLIARSLLSCSFEESAHGPVGKAGSKSVRRPSGPTISSHGMVGPTLHDDDEQVVLKLVSLAALLVRCALQPHQQVSHDHDDDDDDDYDDDIHNSHNRRSRNDQHTDPDKEVPSTNHNNDMAVSPDTPQSSSSATATTSSSSPCLLDTTLIVGLLDTCLHVSHRAKRASGLLKSAAGDALAQIVLVVFSASHLTQARATILARLTELLAVSPNGSSLSSSLTLYDPTACVTSSLTLLNIALETMETAHPAETQILHNDLSKHLLRWSTTQDLWILSLTLRVVFNLFQSMLRNQMKLPLEVFLTSVHLRILLSGSNGMNHHSATTAIDHNSPDGMFSSTAGGTVNGTDNTHSNNNNKLLLSQFIPGINNNNSNNNNNNNNSDVSNEQKEVALESLVEFCQEPSLLQDIYLNYDCDMNCTNLFETICGALCHTALQPGTVHALHTLALEGLLAIVESIARKCDPTAATRKKKKNNKNNNKKSGKNKIGTAAQSSKQQRIQEGNDEDEYEYDDESEEENDQDSENVEKDTNAKVLERTVSDLSEDVDIRRGSLNLSSLQSTNKANQQAAATTNNNNNNKDMMENDDDDDDDDDDNGYDDLGARWQVQESHNKVLQERKRQKHVVQQVTQEFNNRNKDWIRVGQDMELFPNHLTAKSISQFLYSNSGTSSAALDKTELGLYLSKGPTDLYPFEEQVREAFCAAFDFAGLSFADALRTFLSRFRLPGEAQCIDRLMEAFAKELYQQQQRHQGRRRGSRRLSSSSAACLPPTMETASTEEVNVTQNGTKEQNDNATTPSLSATPEPTDNTVDEDGLFRSADAVFRMAFSTIMLNTDLHNPGMKDEKRMTLEQFIRNNRGLNEDEDFPRPFLQDLYQQIKTRELEVHRDFLDALQQKDEEELPDNYWDKVLQRRIAEPFFTPAEAAHSRLYRAGVHDRDMFVIVAKKMTESISSIFVRSMDDMLVLRALRGFEQMIKICVYFDLDETFNDVLQILLGHGRDYIMSCIALEYAGYDGGQIMNAAPAGSLHGGPSILGDKGIMASLGGSMSNIHVSGNTTNRQGSSSNMSSGSNNNNNNNNNNHTNTTSSNNNNNNNNDLVVENPPPVIVGGLETGGNAPTSAPLPQDFLVRSLSFSTNRMTNEAAEGSAAHRGLLALDYGFTLIRTQPSRMREAWPTFIECLCALRDARALPERVILLEDFADSRGNLLTLSPFAKQSQRRLDEYYKSLNNTGSRQKSWFSSLFSTYTSDASTKSITDNSTAATADVTSAATTNQNDKELSYFSKALLQVTKRAKLEDVVLMRPKNLPLAKQTVRALLDAIDAYPYFDDPIFEQHAVYSLELALLALISNRDRVTELYPLFLTKFDTVLRGVHGHGGPASTNNSGGSSSASHNKNSSSSSNNNTTGDGADGDAAEKNVPTPFLMERVVVSILRSCIHLYDIPSIRPQLRTSLHLLMDLPPKFVRYISDRMACGMAIFLSQKFQLLESGTEWDFICDMLDSLANYGPARGFVFDGVANTVESQLTPTSQVGDVRPHLSLEGSMVLCKLLLKFIFGTYQKDMSLCVPAMLCLENLYRHTVLLRVQEEEAKVAAAQLVDVSLINSSSSFSVDGGALVSYVPDKELWQKIAVAYYSVCRCVDPAVSRPGTDCFQRFVASTKMNSLPDETWLTMLHLIVMKQPDVSAEVARINCCSILGKVLLMTIAHLSKNRDNWEDLTDIVNQMAVLIGENLREGRRGTVSPLFESTLQTMTFLCNHMVSEEFTGDHEYGGWVSDTLLSELEKVGAGGGAMRNVAATTKPGDSPTATSETGQNGSTIHEA